MSTDPSTGSGQAPKKRPLPPGWHWARLGEVCQLNPRRPAGFRRAWEAPTTFVPMSAVADNGGGIVSAEVRPYQQVAKGYTYFEEGDVLFAKITPCMENGKSAIATGLVDGVGFGSTEFHVLRPSSLVCAEWLYFFVRRLVFREEAARYFTGAVGQQRVPEEFVSRSLMPLPPLDEQRRIAARLSDQMAQVERMRQAARAQVEAAKALPGAFLRQVFESEEAKQWPRRGLREVCKISMGQSPDGSSYNRAAIGIPLLNGPTEFGRTFPLPIQWTTRPTKVCEPGDILLCVRGATTGRMNIADQPYCIGRGVAALSGVHGLATNDYLYRQLLHVTALVLGETAGSTFPNLPGEKLEKLPIPVPSLPTQQRIVSMLETQMAHAEKLRHAAEAQLEAVKALPGALLEEVFGGFELPSLGIGL